MFRPPHRHLANLSRGGDKFSPDVRSGSLADVCDRPNVSPLCVLSEGRRRLVVAEIASTRRCELPPNFTVWVLGSVHIDVHVTAQ
jgi:hypothetical protein